MAKVIGTTTINHAIRVKLKLNCLEYCVMDFYVNSKATPEMTEYINFLGISSSQVTQIIDSLINKDLLSYGIVSDKWHNEFKADNTLAEQLWAMHRYGNKPTVIKRLPKVLKKISFDDLVVKLKAYLAACENGDVSKKMLSTWLDPEKEHWSDPLPQPMKKLFGQKPEPKQDTKKYIIK